jgi:WD40 repeat protein
VWDAETGGLLFTLIDHENPVRQVVWNPDESPILTRSADGTVRVWDAVTGDELLALTDHGDRVNQALWNSDGSRILTASDDGTVRLWYARMEDLLEAACQAAPRNLAPEEWARYMKHEDDYRATCDNLPLLEE